MIRFAFAIVLLGGIALPAGALEKKAAQKTEPRVTESTLDIPYVPRGGERQRLDVFRPRGEKNCPVVLMVHGGSWMIGDKNFFGMYRDVAVNLASQGMVVVSTNYRLSPWARHPDHVKDVARAFAWTRRNIKDHGGDADSIFLLGHSAGGHLVSLLATDRSHLEDPELKLSDADRKAVRGVVSVGGVYQIPEHKEFAGMVEGMLGGLGPMSNPKEPKNPDASGLLKRSGGLLNPFQLVFGTDPKQLRQASPLHHVRPGLVPFLLLYAEAELPFLPKMAEDFHAALEKAKNRTELARIPRRNHNSLFFRMDEPEDPALKKVLDFIQHHR